MTTMPAKVKERRDDLLRHRQAHIEAQHLHEQELRMCRAELAAIDGEINGIDLTVSAYLEREGVPSVDLIPLKPPRAPRRDVRGMVLDAVKNAPHGASASALSLSLGVRMPHARDVLEYWRDRGEITLRGDVARAVGVTDGHLQMIPVPASAEVAE